MKLDLIDIPLKKNKFDDYPLHQYNLQFPLFALEPAVYMQYVQEQCLNRSAFKPFAQNIKENNKIRNNNSVNFTNYADPPVLQHPKRVVTLSQSEQYEGSYQPNVALAPPAPKKHRYIQKLQENYNNHKEIVDAYPSNEVTSSSVQKSDTKSSSSSLTVIKHEKYIDLDSPRNHVIQKSPDSQSVIDSTVSVVQSTGKLARYNSEIELSTDTDDSASETSEKHTDLYKIEEVLKETNIEAKEKLVNIFKRIMKEKEDNFNESREKDNKIKDLEMRVAELEKRLHEYENNNKMELSSMNSSPSCGDVIRECTPSPPESSSVVIDNKSTTPTIITCDNNNEGDGQKKQIQHIENNNCSSIFYENNHHHDEDDDDDDEQNVVVAATKHIIEDNNHQTSVIATVDKQDTAIIKNEPE